MTTPWPSMRADSTGRLRRLYAHFRTPMARGLSTKALALLRMLWYEYAGDLYTRREDGVLYATCFPSKAEMAAELHVSEKTIDRAMAELTGLGLVEIVSTEESDRVYALPIIDRADSERADKLSDNLSGKAGQIVHAEGQIVHDFGQIVPPIKEEQTQLTDPMKREEISAALSLVSELFGAYPKIASRDRVRDGLLAACGSLVSAGRFATPIEAAAWIVERARAHWAATLAIEPEPMANPLVRLLDSWLAKARYDDDERVSLGYLRPLRTGRSTRQDADAELVAKAFAEPPLRLVGSGVGA